MRRPAIRANDNRGHKNCILRAGKEFTVHQTDANLLAMLNKPAVAAPARLSCGIEGIDNVLGGGFTPHRMYLVEGAPGTGKTTLALQFLLQGVSEGQTGLYIT
ncbi:ATPase domain-containing protein, partial [Klebsiella pneumoniae]|nr:ATPase domain-containing protein [Klebsiella pneumoniae]